MEKMFLLASYLASLLNKINIMRRGRLIEIGLSVLAGINLEAIQYLAFGAKTFLVCHMNG